MAKVRLGSNPLEELHHGKGVIVPESKRVVHPQDTLPRREMGSSPKIGNEPKQRGSLERSMDVYAGRKKRDPAKLAAEIGKFQNKFREDVEKYRKKFEEHKTD